MKVVELIPMGRKAGARIRSRVERIGSGMADRFQAVRSSAAVSKARKAVRRGTKTTTKWFRKNPKALPLLGLGGALATLMVMRSRRKNRQPKLLKGAMKFVSARQFKKGFGFVLGRFIGWALSPRKPLVFRAVSVRW